MDDISMLLRLALPSLPSSSHSFKEMHNDRAASEPSPPPTHTPRQVEVTISCTANMPWPMQGMVETTMVEQVGRGHAATSL